MIVDAQIHLWNAGNPTSLWHRQIPAYLKDDALKEMNAGGVDAAILTPHTPWDPNANELCIEAARAHPDRVAHLIVGGLGAQALQPSGSGDVMAQAMEADDPESIQVPILKSFRHFADEQGEDRLALAAMVRGKSAPLTAGDLAALTMPVLVAAGSQDALAGDPQGLADHIAGAHAVTLPGCDHFNAIPHALLKAAVFDFLDGWLDEIP